MQHEKTKSATFRLNEVNYKKLEAECRREGISLNSLINKIVDRYVDWHAYAAKAGMLSVRRALIPKLLKKYTESEIESLANLVAKETTKDIILLLRQKYNILTALDVIETWVKVANYPYDHHVDSTIHTFVIQHDMTKKWSVYLSHLYQNLFNDFGVKGDFEITENTLTFTINTDEKVIDVD